MWNKVWKAQPEGLLRLQQTLRSHIYTISNQQVTFPGIGHTPRAISSPLGEYSAYVMQVYRQLESFNHN